MIRVNSVTADVQCGGCGNSMAIDIETATSGTGRWEIMDIVEDSVRGGLSEGSTVQAGLALCKSCTELVDSIGSEDYLPTDEEVIAKLKTVKNLS